MSRVPHQYDPARRPDAEFLPGELRFLVPGNRARLLDPRRTPMRVDALDEPRGLVLFRVEAFEDQGAIREVAFEDIGRYQFERGSRTLTIEEVARLLTRQRMLDRPLEIACSDT